MRRFALAAFLLSAALVLLAPSTAWAAPASDPEPEISHLLNRIGFGPRPGDIERVRAIGTERYIDLQLHPERIDDSACDRRLEGLRSLAMSSADIVRTYPGAALVSRIEKRAESGDERARKLLASLVPVDERGNPRDVLVDLASQKLIRAVHSERQLQEVMVDFWMNHFNIYWPKGQDKVYLTAFERDVIRPRALGRFRDLLNATAHSPAMLVYLDNWLSTAETATTADGKRKPGLNENYAREIMELHTLGVDGGYTQRDVVEVARCFTGWTIGRPRGKVSAGATETGSSDFVFRTRMHDNGQKVVLGSTIAAGGGEGDGLAVIDLLSRDPHTARFISLKLCRRFVCDEPSKALVERVAGVFRKTDGDIRAMVRAIITSSEFRSPKVRAAKIKTPFELVASAIRAVNGETQGGLPLANTLRTMGMPLYLCQPPTGYSDLAQAWVSSGALLERMSFAVALTEGRVRGVTAHPEPLLAELPTEVNAMVETLGRRLVGRPLSEETSTTLRKTVGEAPASNRVRQTAGLIIGSPEFQRR